MNAKILAICDSEINYARRLMEAFAEMQPAIFQIYVFSGIESLELFLKDHKVEILLISDCFPWERLKKYPIRKILKLTEQEFSAKSGEKDRIFKYQPGSKIHKQLLHYYADAPGTESEGFHHEHAMELIGIYSPLGRCGKTGFAVSAAKRIACTRKTLLLNLESYSAFGGEEMQEGCWDLSDLIYFLRQGKKTFLYKLGSMIQSMEELDYIVPMKFPGDLRSVDTSEWKELFQLLREQSFYQVVVIDFGHEINGIEMLLDECFHIYMPVLQDFVSQRKMENFERILQEKNFERILDKTEKIMIPEGKEGIEILEYLDQWGKRNLQKYEKSRIAGNI